MERLDFFNESEVGGIKLGHLKNTDHGEFTHDILVKALATEAIVQNLPRQLARYQAAVSMDAVRKASDKVYRNLIAASMRSSLRRVKN